MIERATARQRFRSYGALWRGKMREADDVLGHGSPEMVVLLCAEERQKALLRNEARRIAANIVKLPELVKRPQY